MDVDESTERGEFFVRLPADFEQQKEEEQLMNVKQIGMADETTGGGGGGGAAAGVGADDGDADEAGDVAPVVDVRSRILAARTQTPPASQLSNGLSSHPAGRVDRGGRDGRDDRGGGGGYQERGYRRGADAPPPPPSAAPPVPSAAAPSTSGFGARVVESTSPPAVESMPDAAQDAELEAAVKEFLSANGGGESSRNVGRHLAARGLLTALKARYSGLFHFLQAKPETFALDLNKRGDDKSGLEYYVRLETGSTKDDAEEAEAAEVER